MQLLTSLDAMADFPTYNFFDYSFCPLFTCFRNVSSGSSLKIGFGSLRAAGRPLYWLRLSTFAIWANIFFLLLLSTKILSKSILSCSDNIAFLSAHKLLLKFILVQVENILVVVICSCKTIVPIRVISAAHQLLPDTQFCIAVDPFLKLSSTGP